MKYKIKGTKYSRDLNTMAVMCTDKAEVLKYNSEIKKHQENKRRDEEINNLRQEVSELKDMIKVLIDRG